MAGAERGRWVAGVDLGGTKIAAGLLRWTPGRQGVGGPALPAEPLALVARTRRPTPAREGPAAVLAAMAEAVRELCAQAGVEPSALAAAGVGAPGPLDAARGVVVRAPNLGWHEVDVVGPLRAALGCPVFLENDANAAALGEWWAGAGRGARHFVYVTVSTGIGGGIVLDGRLYTGAHGAAGEVGHMVVAPGQGPVCGCGQRGCLEALASGTAIARRAQEALRAAPAGQGQMLLELAGQRPDGVDARVVAEAARRGDALARQVLEETWRYLGAGLVTLVNLLDPEVVALGGGVARMGELMLQPLRRHLQEHAVPGPARGTRLVAAELGDDAGVLGAAAVALQRLGWL